MSPKLFLRYALLPARLNALLVILMLSLGAVLVSHAGLIGIPLAVMLACCLLQYAYIVLEQVAHGRDQPPVLSLEMINPAHEPRPAAQALIVLLVAAVLGLIGHLLSVALALLLGIVAIIALPASIGVLTLSESMVQAMHPLTLWRLASALKGSYAAIVALAILYGLGLALIHDASTLLLAAAASFAWLSIYALIGGSLYEAREALGHVPIDSPERREQRRARELERERAGFIDTVYAQARGGNLAGAWHTIERELAAQRHAADFCDWLLLRLQALDSPRLANRLAQDAISRALSHDNGRVLRLVRQQLQRDVSFRPRSAAETLRVAELARLAGDRRCALTLLQDFAQQFAGDAATGQAAQLYQSLGGEPPR